MLGSGWLLFGLVITSPALAHAHRDDVLLFHVHLFNVYHRELAMQSHEVVVAIGGIKGVCIYGGVPKPQQKVSGCCTVLVVTTVILTASKLAFGV